MTHRTKKVILLVVIGLVIFGAVIAGWFVYKNYFSKDKDISTRTSKVDFQEVNSGIAQAGTSDEDLGNLVKEYGSQYDAALANVRKVLPANWGTVEINEAHLCLLYADKISSYSQVQDLYFTINTAKESGIDVDSNSSGVTQSDRDAIKARADAAMANVQMVKEVQK